MIPLRILSARVFPGQKVALNPAILEPVQQRTAGAFSVPASAADLLIIAFERIREIEVDDKTDVGFINSKAERFGRDNDVEGSIHELLLSGLTFTQLHFSVIARRIDVFGAEPIVQLICGSHCSNVDDSTPVRFAKDGQNPLPLGFAIDG